MRVELGVRGGRLYGLVLATVAVVAGTVAGLCLGSGDLPVGDVVRAVTAGGPDPARQVVWDLRFPRTVLALTCGMALGVAGALLQSHSRNPLAEPGLLGVTAGASCAVVLAIHLVGVHTPAGYLAAAALGSGLTVAAVVVLALSSGGGDPLGLVVVGAGISAVLGGVTTGVVLSDPTAQDALRLWSIGSASGRGWDVVAVTAPVVVVGTVAALFTGRTLDQLALGEETAEALGLRIWPARFTGMALVAVLTATATAACGPVAFAGLLVPALVRPVAAGAHGWLLALSAVTGAAVLAWCDILGRILLAPMEVEMGVMVAALGVPTLVLMLVRGRSGAIR